MFECHFRIGLRLVRFEGTVRAIAPGEIRLPKHRLLIEVLGRAVFLSAR